MILPRLPLSGKAQAYLLVLVSFAFAALQNVTVDDAVLAGLVIPKYLPSDSVWNIGNHCNVCIVRPDPLLAYNGTWHDATYSPHNTYTQAIEFAFTGNGLYIFFVIANNVTGATTFTNVDFLLDGVRVSSYIHAPLSSTDYQYNVPVYTNGSLSFGQHQMMIQPVDSGSHMLMLFDYLIYTIDTSGSVPATAIPSLSPTLSGPGTSSTPNVGAIVGGSIGGITMCALLAFSFLCYRRHIGGRPLSEEKAVAPFILSREAVITPFTTRSTCPISSRIEPTTRIKMGISHVNLQPSHTPAIVMEPSSEVASSDTDAVLFEQIQLLKDEVSHLRHLQDQNCNATMSVVPLSAYTGYR